MNYIFGKKAILDAIKNNKKINEIKLIKNYNDLIEICKNNKIKYQIVGQEYFNQYSGVNHQNVVAFLNNEIDYVDLNYVLSNNIGLILILDSIESPQNFGSILRSALAFNVDLIIFKNKNQCPINDLVIKTSMGAINYLKFVKVSNINQSIDFLKNNGYWIYGTSLENNSISLDKIKFDSKCVIVMGNENNGVSKLTLQKCDFVIKINMNELIDSLNVSVATGIILNKINEQKT